jgi:hypothetical protein
MLTPTCLQEDISSTCPLMSYSTFNRSSCPYSHLPTACPQRLAYHSSLNSSIHPSTSSERKHTTALCVSYTIRLDGCNTPHNDDAIAMCHPTSCCMCRNLTHVTTLGPFVLAPGAHHTRGTTQMFGMAALCMAESHRTSDNCISSTGICYGSGTFYTWGLLLLLIAYVSPSPSRSPCLESCAFALHDSTRSSVTRHHGV